MQAGRTLGNPTLPAPTARALVGTLRLGLATEMPAAHAAPLLGFSPSRPAIDVLESVPCAIVHRCMASGEVHRTPTLLLDGVALHRGAYDADILGDLEYFHQVWKEIKHKSETQRSPAVDEL